MRSSFCSSTCTQSKSHNKSCKFLLQSLPSIMRHLILVLTCLSTAIVSPGATQTCLPNLTSFSYYISKSEVTLCQEASPYNLFEDLVVEHNSKLTLGPGTVIKFAPRKGIIVRGALVVQVSFTKIVNVLRQCCVIQKLVLQPALDVVSFE